MIYTEQGNTTIKEHTEKKKNTKKKKKSLGNGTNPELTKSQERTPAELAPKARRLKPSLNLPFYCSFPSVQHSIYITTGSHNGVSVPF